jgi:hypothetical protein
MWIMKLCAILTSEAKEMLKTVSLRALCNVTELASAEKGMFGVLNDVVS